MLSKTRLAPLLALMAGAVHAQAVDVTDKRVVQNEAAYVPPQCYTKTVDDKGNSHNPCFACHIGPKAPNFLDDRDLQESYAFREYSKGNRWDNLFKDFSAAVADIDDKAMMAYLKGDNYKDADGTITLARKLAQVPGEWDFDQDGQWDGFVPDVAFNFDREGFDLAESGEPTGWRAFAYYPFLGTFFPTNGATDDVLIRLPEAFRQNSQGQYDQGIYKLNLAILEALIKRQDVAIEATDEKALGLDVDKDGSLAMARQVSYGWAPREGLSMSYVGKAGELLKAGKLKLAAGLYPVGTEFVHSVRYLDVSKDGQLAMSKRMKELRYSRKTNWNTYSQLYNAAISEVKETHDFPDRLRTFRGDAEHGMQSGLGWVYQGFIEDEKGELRPQSYEESMACMGCHSGVSATTDTTFAFARKFGAEQLMAGWYHWSQSNQGFKGLAEPAMDDGRGEYSTYLKANGAGDEYRANGEVMARFFSAGGQPDAAALKAMSRDISKLLVPSHDRAMELNKAYWSIVKEQSFIKGRDPHVKPLTGVHKEVEIETPTQVTPVSR